MGCMMFDWLKRLRDRSMPYITLEDYVNRISAGLVIQVRCGLGR